MSWRSEQCTRKTRLIDVIYHPANNEYVRTKVITKSAIISIDATPFRVWYRNHYNIDITRNGAEKLDFKKDVSTEERAKIEKRQKEQVLPENILRQLQQGRILARVTAKPGQVGRADGYILEAEELEFYEQKIRDKKKKK